jgi:hypothetical protein
MLSDTFPPSRRATVLAIYSSGIYLGGGLGLALLAFTGYGIAGWTPVFFRRVLAQPTGEVGTIVGLTAAVAGVIGITLGGLLADRLRATRPEGRLYVGSAARCS